MITGFNTDVVHNGKVYHVQTEDKGQENPTIESLIYVGGEIMASERSSYADLVEAGLEKKDLESRMEEQHNRLIKQIKSGHFDPPEAKAFGDGIISSKSLDQVIIEYLETEMTEERLVLHLESSGPIKSGTTVPLTLSTRTNLSKKPIPGAKVVIKIISTTTKPVTAFEGKTDPQGHLATDLTIPSFTSGNAALIIQAVADEGTDEIKQLIQIARPVPAGDSSHPNHQVP